MVEPRIRADPDSGWAGSGESALAAPTAGLSIIATTPDEPRAAALIDELSADLIVKTGGDGRDSFANHDVTHPRSVFLLALLNGEPVGCGALRPMDGRTCEIKRMYARRRGGGIGATVLLCANYRKYVGRPECVCLEKLWSNPPESLFK